MAKEVDLILNNLQGHVLSPGNIFWLQKSGTKLLIAKKSDYLNFQLIEKLFKADHHLIIEDPISVEVQNEFLEIIKSHSSELLFKEKIKWQNRLFELLTHCKINQCELSQLTWMAWSQIDKDLAKNLIDFDLDLFRRSLNVATAYVYCAMMLGYYQDDYLKVIFNSALKELMSMEKIELMAQLKTDLEKIRHTDSLTDESKNFLKKAYPKTLSWAGERYDGSGVHGYNLKELSDLEIVMIGLERHYSYDAVDGLTIFDEIMNGNFVCDEKILAILKRRLTKGQQRQIDSAVSA